MRVLVITTGAYGGKGGIAQYNRDFLKALCNIHDLEEVVVVPRKIDFNPISVPEKITYISSASNNKFNFMLSIIGQLHRSFDIVICGHINLLPFAKLLNIKIRAPLVLLVYGIDVWNPHTSRLVRHSLKSVTLFFSISKITRKKMIQWSGISRERFSILPNAIDMVTYSPGEKSKFLIDKYKLNQKKVITFLGRLSSLERYKGVDEVLESLSTILTKEPNAFFLIIGDGDDKDRLNKKVSELKLNKHVLFLGFIDESQKIEHLRLSDVFVMPGRGEGFGFVFLEAMACGIPVVASKLDGSREAVMNGKLGALVNPNNKGEIINAILLQINKPKIVPIELAFFSVLEFEKKVEAGVRLLLDD